MTDTILDLTRLLPGPLATRMLADMGFRVHRILPPQGDLTAKMNPDLYAWLNVGKSASCECRHAGSKRSNSPLAAR